MNAVVAVHSGGRLKSFEELDDREAAVTVEPVARALAHVVYVVRGDSVAEAEVGWELSVWSTICVKMTLG